MGFDYKWNKKHIYCRFLLIVIIVIVSSLASTFLTNAQENESVNSTVNQTNQTKITTPYIDPEISKAFENNQTWVRVAVKYEGDVKVTFENEEEMAVYYFNSSIAKSFFSYIPETEIRNIQGGLSALQPFFTAEVTRQGLDKLANNSRVTKIYFDIPAYSFQNQSVSENTSLLNNKTIIEKTKEKESSKKETIFLILLFLVILIIFVLLASYLLIRRKKQ